MSKRFVTYALRRLEAGFAQIEDLLGSEFPYPASREALEVLKQDVLNDKLHLESVLDRSERGSATRVELQHDIRRLCVTSLTNLNKFLPLLGFLLRSTNSRNAFEVYRPFRRLAASILRESENPDEGGIRIIVSSEWDYSPLVHLPSRFLRGFLCVGFPAHESRNPLLLPVAGHELGHEVWRRRSEGLDIPTMVAEAMKILETSTDGKPASSSPAEILAQVIRIIQHRWPDCTTVYPHLKNLKPEIAVLFGQYGLYGGQTWEYALPWASNQIEETFCDFFALRLFRESYLHAFAYLLSPAVQTSRKGDHPREVTRAKCLEKAATSYSLSVPPEYAEMFEDLPDDDKSRISDISTGTPTREQDFKLLRPKAMTDREVFQLSVADEACSAFEEILIDMAEKEIPDVPGLASTTDSDIDRIMHRFRQGVPAENCKSIVDILNAAWKAYDDPKLWKEMPEINPRKDRILKNLVLKNLEVFEIEQLRLEEKGPLTDE